MRLPFSILLCLLMGCTSAPNGAINYDTTSYYIDGKFHESIPKEYVLKNYGYLLIDDLNQKQHTYSTPVIQRQNSSITLYCTIHKGWEDVKFMYLLSKKSHGVVIQKNKRF